MKEDGSDKVLHVLHGCLFECCSEKYFWVSFPLKNICYTRLEFLQLNAANIIGVNGLNEMEYKLLQ